MNPRASDCRRPGLQWPRPSQTAELLPIRTWLLPSAPGIPVQQKVHNAYFVPFKEGITTFAIEPEHYSIWRL